MPRKVQYDKQMIIEAAIEMVREHGIGSINARDLGAKLGCSSRPLFTAFKNMDELIETTRQEVSDRFIKEILTDETTWTKERENQPIHGTSSTREFGIRIVKFAKREPNLYNFIHWRGGEMPDIIKLNEIMAERYSAEFGLTIQEANTLFTQMSLFSLGLCSMITYGVKEYTDEEINELLTQQFISNFLYIKNKGQ